MGRGLIDVVSGMCRGARRGLKRELLRDADGHQFSAERRSDNVRGAIFVLEKQGGADFNGASIVYALYRSECVLQ